MSNSSARFYRSGGLLIESTFALDDLALPDSPGTPDLRIEAATQRQIEEFSSGFVPVKEVEWDGKVWLEVFAEPGGLAGHLVRWPERLEIAAHPDGRLMQVRLLGDLNDSLARLILCFGMSFVLPAHELEGFHASAVEIDGRAIMVSAPSGFGKSTSATALCLEGGRLLSDDLTVVRMVEGRPFIEPVTTKTMLYREVAEGLFGADTVDLGRALKLAVGKVELAADRVPLAAIYLPRYDRDASGLEISRPMQGTEALTALLPHFFNRSVKSTVRSAIQFRYATEMVAHAPVRTITWKPGPSVAREFAVWAIDDLRSLHP